MLFHSTPIWRLQELAGPKYTANIIIFEVAKRCCFIISAIPKETAVMHQPMEIDNQDTLKREDNLGEALKKKGREKVEKSASRRRARGGAPSTGGGRSATSDKTSPEVIDVVKDDPDLTVTLIDASNDFTLDLFTQDDLNPHDRMLAESQPRFIVMFEPSVEFIRRVEVYRSSYPGMAVRAYHMVYANSCEEHRYLAVIRKEKESFEWLFKERGSMLLTLEERRKPGGDGQAENVIRTISTRLAGERRELTIEPPKIIVDMREFRSALPSLLHATRLLVVPATLTVGDYINTPDICVERKITTIQSELVLLTFSFPRLRIIWSQSPYVTAEIFKDLIKAITIGAGGDDPDDVGFNIVAEELVRALPGIGSGGLASSSGIVNTAMRRCENVRELCKGVVGVGPGRVLYDFLHKGDLTSSLSTAERDVKSNLIGHYRSYFYPTPTPYFDAPYILLHESWLLSRHFHEASINEASGGFSSI
ncbi:hypothetical protein AGABI1DRAFT_109572 [Agaricus bisporus var. burnettii JB137-S8]|uniref:ERCC4 domain-containing protein n=1 Tax=Agaricus bisporus var. burnettii (strain JB137-S8 / ATCC MYA-4627 / FGSC 10392) TaxID=597362 RepID=K5WJ37_AGABU|nr:uncharacterized protein AGABI1DRAFT_109572 [Agaricus bisporus var. burnettii JB137-S8]EKM75301.1 hypothetical protein AGABI1DRAFT_109572 [Agaricus bisporus var. burnettii JB137-S8]